MVSGIEIAEKTLISSLSGTPTISNQSRWSYSVEVAPFDDLSYSYSTYYNRYKIGHSTGTSISARTKTITLSASDIKPNINSSGYAYAYLFASGTDVFLDRTTHLTTSSTAPHITCITDDNGNCTDDYDLTCIKMKCSSSGAVQSMSLVSVYVNQYSTKGTTKYSNVTSTSSSTYPSNGAKGSYWYVKIS